MRRVDVAVMRRLAVMLRSADTFCEIACVLDTFVGDAVELRGFGVEVRDANLVPLAGVTNFLSKASIERYWRDGYARDPLPGCIAATERAVSYAEVMSPEALAAENERHGVDARLGLEPDLLWGAPIAGLGELGGIFRAVSWELPSRAWVRDIETVGRLLAIRFAQLGLTPQPPSFAARTGRCLSYGDPAVLPVGCAYAER